MSARSAANETAARREAKNPSTVAREELLAKIAEIRAALQTDADNGIAYATDKLESWQYTGNKSGVADTLPELNDALAAADTLVADDAATTEDLRSQRPGFPVRRSAHPARDQHLDPRHHRYGHQG